MSEAWTKAKTFGGYVVQRFNKKEASTWLGLVLVLASGGGYLTLEQITLIKAIASVFGVEVDVATTVLSQISGALGIGGAGAILYKPGKVNAWALTAVCAALFAATCPDRSYAAEVISTHNEQHAAENAARDRLRSQGCAWTKTSRVEPYRLVDDPKGVRVYGNELLIVCVERSTGSLSSIVVSWAAPGKRADGSPLALDEIAGYWVRVDGEKFGAGNVTALQIDKVAPGSRSITLQTVDTDGQVSELSPAFVIPVPG